MVVILFGAVFLFLPIILAIVSYWGGYDDLGEALWTWFLAVIVTGIVLAVAGGISFGIVSTGHVDGVKTRTSHLQALDTGSSVEGQSYFLGGAYVEGKRVLNYIVEKKDENGKTYSAVKQVNADKARIYQDAVDGSTVTIKTPHRENGWFIPGPIDGDSTYEFHVPKGSVLDSYKVTNK